MADDALIDGLKETILEEIRDDWPTLSADPARVAERVARLLAPRLGETPEADEISGAPWSTR